MACISADKKHLPLILIYKAVSYDLQKSWDEDFREGEEVYFTVSATGWSSDELRLRWLSRVFKADTRSKAGNHQRLLLVDGYSTYVNLKFLEFTDTHRILVLVLPAHPMHRLQPLDIGLFAPLTKAYNNELNDLMHRSLEMVSIFKRMFWPMFRTAWFARFTEKNIVSSFAQPGICAYDLITVLKVIQPRATTPEQEDIMLPKTPFQRKFGGVMA